MPAYLLLLVAVLSRLLPHAPWFNFTAVGGVLLYFGARRSWKEMITPLTALMTTDFILTVYIYHYHFQLQDYLPTWGWYLGAMALGRILLSKRVTLLRAATGALLGPTSFFLISNFAYWVMYNQYPHTVAGLGVCYTAGLPFYRNDVVSTALVVALAFGIPDLARQVNRGRAQAVTVNK